MLIIVSDRGRIYKRSAFIILSYREYEKRRGMNEKIQDESYYMNIGLVQCKYIAIHKYNTIHIHHQIEDNNI